jgi:NTE family protein
MPAHPLDDLLLHHLRALLDGADDDALASLREPLSWHELPAGAPLMHEGEPGDAMYLLVSGRLRVSQVVRDADGGEGGVRVLREITRGQVVGEMSLFSDAPRSATLVAVRDSVLARLARPDFDALLRRHPAVSMALTRQIIARLQTEGRAARHDRPVVVTLLPLGGRVDDAVASALVARLAAALSRHGRVACLDAAEVSARLGQAPADDAATQRRVALLLDQVEASHDVVLLRADATPSAWTRCCARQGDELLLLAHADDDPAPGAIEQACGLLAAPAAGQGARAAAGSVLLLLHPEGRASPADTARWRAPRRLLAHVHLRQGPGPAHEADVARLARLVARRGVGLVLSGGGARGAAHAGVYRALHERGVPVDAIGGTSMGAVFGALMAFDPRADEVVDTFAALFAANPTGDFTLLPLLSLIKGRRLRTMMQRTEQRFGGRSGLGIEDLWKPYFCVVTNYSAAREQVLIEGPLVEAVTASCAIPGALPPVLRDGELLCDGGVFNNFPVDVMRGCWGIGRVIGVDLGLDPTRRIELDALPTPTQLALDRLRPRRRRRYRLPSLASILMNATALQGTARQREAAMQADLLLKPALPRIGMLQWSRFADAVRIGYDEALRVLDAAGPGWAIEGEGDGKAG